MSAVTVDTRAATTLLEVEGLRKHFPFASRLPFARPRAWVRAVDGVSFRVRAGETLSIVGESGCGKTTVGKLILGLERPTAGKVFFLGQELGDRRREALGRGGSPIQAVFQDPWSSLNPRLRVERIVAEPLVVTRNLSRSEIQARVKELLTFVGIDPATMRNFPHEFSGGQRQRIAIARALTSRPKLIVLDEPVSALDVSIRAQIINLLRDVQRELGTAYVMIAHDLATVRFLSHSVVVMYLGVVVEEAAPEQLFTNPLHPYTKALLSASLPLRPEAAAERIRLEGEVPSPASPPSGCRFRTRCPYAFDRCAAEVPAYREVLPGQRVACHLYD